MSVLGRELIDAAMNKLSREILFLIEQGNGFVEICKKTNTAKSLVEVVIRRLIELKRVRVQF